MSTKTQIRVAKEIKTNFKLILLSLLLTLVSYGVLYVALKPPVNPPISEKYLKEIKEKSRSGSPYIQVGLAFKTHSKYDSGMPLSYIIDDRINEYRQRQFRHDIEDKTIMAFFILLIGLIGGRYIVLTVKWVSQTSKLDANDNGETKNVVKRVEDIESIHKEPKKESDLKVLMEKYNIIFDNDKYIYLTYKYDRLVDAINYAELMERKNK